MIYGKLPVVFLSTIASEKNGSTNCVIATYILEHLDEMQDIGIKEIAKNYLYVFPRAHCIEYILIYAKLAYYAKTDSRAFSKIVFKAKHSVSLI